MMFDRQVVVRGGSKPMLAVITRTQWVYNQQNRFNGNAYGNVSKWKATSSIGYSFNTKRDDSVMDRILGC